LGFRDDGFHGLGLGSMAWASGFRAQGTIVRSGKGLRLRVQGLGFRDDGFRFRVCSLKV
jgi:hypothetical protein